MRNYEMVLMALKSGQSKSAADLKAELPGLEWWNMAKYVARAKYLAGAEIELMKAGKPIKAARARDAETLRLVNADKFKNYNPETKTGGPLFRKSNPKVKTKKTPTPKPVKVASKVASKTKPKIPSTNLVNPVASPSQPEYGKLVVDQIKAELAASEPKRAAALPRGPKNKPVEPPKVKVERVSNEVSANMSDDPLDIPDFLRVKSSKAKE